MTTKRSPAKVTSKKAAATMALPPIDERAVRSLDQGELFDDELDPLGLAGATGARPPNRYEARPPNRYEARPPNRYEARPPNRYEARPPNRYEHRTVAVG